MNLQKLIKLEAFLDERLSELSRTEPIGVTKVLAYLKKRNAPTPVAESIDNIGKLLKRPTKVPAKGWFPERSSMNG